MLIIDTHQHLGTSMFSGTTTTEPEILAAMDRHEVSQMLVMPQPTLEPVEPIHDRIANLAQSSGRRIFGMASINPWIGRALYLTEARRCVTELGFVALKLHPLGHNLSPDHPAAAVCFEAAAELRVPVIVHTGLGVPWSLPALCIPAARRFPNVPLVLAHAGWGVYSQEALIVADECPNVILEPSWCPTYVARKAVDRIGAERVIFGSDHLQNLPVELTKYRSIDLTTAQLEQVLGRNAKRLFSLSDPN